MKSFSKSSLEIGEINVPQNNTISEVSDIFLNVGNNLNVMIVDINQIT